MTIAIIPVKGRTQLVPHTIAQALKVVDKVICVVSRWNKNTDFSGATEVLNVKAHVRLGAKWNAGFEAARKYDPDHVLFIGSSDWVSENWMDVMLPHTEDCDIVGVESFNLLHLEYKVMHGEVELRHKRAHSGHHKVDVKFDEMSLGLWGGYTNSRRGEPIGIGRVLNREFLKRIDYKPFDDDKKNGMDLNMFNLAKSYKVVPYDDIKCLSISTNLWSNFHKFDDAEAVNGNFLDKWFPDAYRLTEWNEVELLNKDSGLVWNVPDVY